MAPINATRTLNFRMTVQCYNPSVIRIIYSTIFEHVKKVMATGILKICSILSVTEDCPSNGIKSADFQIKLLQKYYLVWERGAIMRGGTTMNPN